MLAQKTKNAIQKILNNIQDEYIKKIDFDLYFDPEDGGCSFYNEEAGYWHYVYSLQINFTTKWGTIPHIDVELEDSAAHYEKDIIINDPLDLLEPLAYYWDIFQTYTVFDYIKETDLINMFSNFDRFLDAHEKLMQIDTACQQLKTLDHPKVFEKIFWLILESY